MLQQWLWASYPQKSYAGYPIPYPALYERGSTIPRLNKREVKNLLISLPSFEDQRAISEITTKIENSLHALEDIKDSLSHNPISSEKEREKLDAITNAISDMSPLLREESIIHEFKASLRTPYPDPPEVQVNKDGKQEYKLGTLSFSSMKQVRSYLEKIVLKCIASFLNTKGGTLVIGVHEFGNIKKVVGVEREGFKSLDHYERHLIQLVNNAFGKVVVSKYVSTKMNQIDGHTVCVVTLDQYLGDDLVYLDDRVYVRTGPRVDELTIRQVVELIKQRKPSEEGI